MRLEKPARAKKEKTRKMKKTPSSNAVGTMSIKVRNYEHKKTACSAVPHLGWSGDPFINKTIRCCLVSCVRRCCKSIGGSASWSKHKSDNTIESCRNLNTRVECIPQTHCKAARPLVISVERLIHLQNRYFTAELLQQRNMESGDDNQTYQ